VSVSNVPSRPAVDEDDAVEVAVARAAGEVPRRVGGGDRRAERVPAEDDALARPRGAEDDAADVLELHAQPPVADEAEPLRVERLVPRGDRRVGEPAEVEVERRLRRAPPGVRLGEHPSVLERLRAAVERPDLQPRHLADEVAADEREAARAGEKPGTSTRTVFALDGPIFVTKLLSYFAGRRRDAGHGDGGLRLRGRGGGEEGGAQQAATRTRRDMGPTLPAWLPSS
jgi:hypothetical protein